MKVNINDIYTKVAEDNSLNEKLVILIGRTIFDSLLEELQEGSELSYYLPKLGTFTRRFKKFERYFHKKKNMSKKELERCTKIFNRMQEYRIDKAEFRKKTFENYDEIYDPGDGRILKEID